MAWLLTPTTALNSLLRYCYSLFFSSCLAPFFLALPPNSFPLSTVTPPMVFLELPEALQSLPRKCLDHKIFRVRSQTLIMTVRDSEVGVRWGEDRSWEQYWVLQPAHMSDTATSTPLPPLPIEASITSIKQLPPLGPCSAFTRRTKNSLFLSQQNLLLVLNERGEGETSPTEPEKHQPEKHWKVGPLL